MFLQYEKAASILSSNDPPVILAKVDANEEKNRELASQFQVQGFPTIKILRNGGKVVQDYKGPREADGIVDYLKKQSGPATAEIKSADDASALIGKNKVVIVSDLPSCFYVCFDLYSHVILFYNIIRLGSSQNFLGRSMRTSMHWQRNCVLNMISVTPWMPNTFHVENHR